MIIPLSPRFGPKASLAGAMRLLFGASAIHAVTNDKTDICMTCAFQTSRTLSSTHLGLPLMRLVLNDSIDPAQVLLGPAEPSRGKVGGFPGARRNAGLVVMADIIRSSIGKLRVAAADVLCFRLARDARAL